MRDPERILEDRAASPALRALLRRAPPARALDNSARVRGRARLARLTAMPVGVTILLGWKAALATFGIAAGAGTVVLVGVTELITASHADKPAAESEVSRTPPRSVTPRAPKAILPENVRPLRPVVIAPTPSSGTPSAGPSSAKGASSADDSRDGLAEESALLEEARRLLGSAPAEALRLARVHKSRFARGELSSERALIEVEALHQLGRDAEARRLADRLLATGADGFYAERLRRLVSKIDE